MKDIIEKQYLEQTLFYNEKIAAQNCLQSYSMLEEKLAAHRSLADHSSVIKHLSKWRTPFKKKIHQPEISFSC